MPPPEDVAALLHSLGDPPIAGGGHTGELLRRSRRTRSLGRNRTHPQHRPARSASRRKDTRIIGVGTAETDRADASTSGVSEALCPLQVRRGRRFHLPSGNHCRPPTDLGTTSLGLLTRARACASAAKVQSYPGGEYMPFGRGKRQPLAVIRCARSVRHDRTVDMPLGRTSIESGSTGRRDRRAIPRRSCRPRRLSGAEPQ